MLYITIDDNLATCAQTFKSLQQFSDNYCEPDFLADLRDKGESKEVHCLRVFKTKKAWLNGFDYTLYFWNGDKLRKATHANAKFIKNELKRRAVNDLKRRAAAWAA